MAIVEWFQLNWGWRRGDADGDDTVTDRDDGTGDFVFNSLTKIVEDGDTSEWAIFSFLFFASLLRLGWRWPLEFDIGTEAPNRWVWYPYHFIVKTVLKRQIKWTRPRTDMTRDPYKAFRLCYAHLIKENDGNYDILLRYAFLSVKPKWYCYRPGMWAEWKRTTKNTRKHYVKRLDKIDGKATDILFEKFYADDFYKNKP